MNSVLLKKLECVEVIDPDTMPSFSDFVPSGIYLKWPWMTEVKQMFVANHNYDYFKIVDLDQCWLAVDYNGAVAIHRKRPSIHVDQYGSRWEGGGGWVLVGTSYNRDLELTEDEVKQCIWKVTDLKNVSTNTVTVFDPTMGIFC